MEKAGSGRKARLDVLIDDDLRVQIVDACRKRKISLTDAVSEGMSIWLDSSVADNSVSIQILRKYQRKVSRLITVLEQLQYLREHGAITDDDINRLLTTHNGALEFLERYGRQKAKSGRKEPPTSHR